MFGANYFRGKFFGARLFTRTTEQTNQGGTFLLALHGTGGASNATTPPPTGFFEYVVKARRWGRR